MERSPAGQRAGRTVLVTGASGGIGRATALGLTVMGWHVAITGRDRGRAEAAAREIRAAGRKRLSRRGELLGLDGAVYAAIPAGGERFRQSGLSVLPFIEGAEHVDIAHSVLHRVLD
jgi:NAD(P)-dependent dehydrogenase (short-subunit alcohol dehydrogenase family)